jgi:hypothetical protein
MGALGWFSLECEVRSAKMQKDTGFDRFGGLASILLILNAFSHETVRSARNRYCFNGISGESKMTKAKFFVAAALLATAALAPSLADARHSRHHLHNWGLPYPISYLHNYGPGVQPGTFAYYDGPSTVLCRQGAAAYIGQDRRRHPCY